VEVENNVVLIDFRGDEWSMSFGMETIDILCDCKADVVGVLEGCESEMCGVWESVAYWIRSRGGVVAKGRTGGGGRTWRVT